MTPKVAQEVHGVTETAALVTLDEAAKFLSCTPAAVRRWIAQGRLPRVKLGRLTRLRRTDLERIVRDGLPPAHH